jgi:DNA-binding IclR family transcriptional regulator
VLSVFRTDTELLALNDITLRSGLPKSMAFRLLYTLRHVGLVEKAAKNLYRSRALVWRTQSLEVRRTKTGTAKPRCVQACAPWP